jgi:preprotein translocase subunit SecD
MRANQKRLIVTVVVLIAALLPLLIPHGSAPSESSFFDKIAANIKLGLDIKGGALLEYQMVTDVSRDEMNALADRVIEVLRTRLDAAGFTEATVEKITAGISFGEDIPPVRVRVQIPGITDVSRAESLVGKTGKLYFADVLAIETSSSMPPIPAGMSLEISRRKLQGAEPFWLKDLHFGEFSGGVQNNTWYFVSPKISVGASYAELDGSVVTEAKSLVNSQPRPGQGRFMVSLRFSSEGARIFREVTAIKATYADSDMKKRLAIILDDRVIIAPLVQTQIGDGNAVIEGLNTIDEAREVAILVGSGNLPVELSSFNKRVLSPTLGRDIINASLWAGLAGLALIMIYMVVIYKNMGLVADLALLYNAILLLGMVSLTGSILTLPGIAGIVLTIGMTVDGNVLIFERIKEELRIGKTPENAIDSAFSKVVWTIFDANLTTILAGLVLFYFGTGTVKGFAVTLVIGVLGAMFTNIIVSRTVLTGMAGSLKPERFVKVGQTSEGRDVK